MKRLCLFACFAALALAAGCAATAPVPTPAPAPAPDGTGALAEGVAYEVLSVDGRRLPAGSGAGFSVRDGSIGGSDGCNRFFGPVVQTPAMLRIGPLAGTRMACPPAVMDRAMALTRALEQVDGVRSGPGGTVALTASGRDRVILRRPRP